MVLVYFIMEVLDGPFQVILIYFYRKYSTDSSKYQSMVEKYIFGIRKLLFQFWAILWNTSRNVLSNVKYVLFLSSYTRIILKCRKYKYTHEGSYLPFDVKQYYAFILLSQYIFS